MLGQVSLKHFHQPHLALHVGTAEEREQPQTHKLQIVDGNKLTKQDLIDFQSGLMQGNRQRSIQRSRQFLQHCIFVHDDALVIGQQVLQFGQPQGQF